jgi:hypothetical protein
MRDLLTSLLDVLGLLLVAAGVCAALFPAIGWAGLAGSGVVVLAGSWWSARQVRPVGGRE